MQWDEGIDFTMWLPPPLERSHYKVESETKESIEDEVGIYDPAWCETQESDIGEEELFSPYRVRPVRTFRRNIESYDNKENH